MTEPENLYDQSPAAEMPADSAEANAVMEAPEQPEVRSARTEDPAPAAAPHGNADPGAQTWYLLNCLAAAPDRQMKWGDIKRKGIIKKAREQLLLTEQTAEQLLQEIKQKGLVQTSDKRGTVVYELTDAGEQQLGNMEPPAEFAELAVMIPVSEETMRYQCAYLLLDLLAAPDQTLQKAQANSRISKQAQADLQLTPAVASVRRLQLAKQGYIEIDKQGRQESYHLTADGRDYLAALEQHPNTEFRIRGETINKLLSASRETPARNNPSEERSNEIPVNSGYVT